METKLAQGKLGKYSVVFLWDLQSLHIISIEDQVYSSRIPLSEVQSQAKIIEMSPNDYISKMFDIMEHQQRENYLSLTPTDNNNNLKLTWSKELRRGIKIILGIFNLHTCDNLIDFVQQFTNPILNHIKTLTSLNSQLQKENKLLQQVTNSALEKYEKVISNQEERELSLLSKFAAVLNEKKRKISSLTSGSNHQESVDLVNSTSAKSDEIMDSSIPNQIRPNDPNRDDVDDNDLLLPEIPRTSKSLLNRSYATRKSNRITKNEPAKVSEQPQTTSCHESDVSIDNLINSL